MITVKRQVIERSSKNENNPCMESTSSGNVDKLRKTVYYLFIIFCKQQIYMNIFSDESNYLK